MVRTVALRGAKYIIIENKIDIESSGLLELADDIISSSKSPRERSEIISMVLNDLLEESSKPRSQGIRSILMGVYSTDLSRENRNQSKMLLQKHFDEKIFPEVTHTGVLTSNMNLRKEPRMKGHLIKLLPKRTQFVIHDEKTGNRCSSWISITTGSGTSGWFCGFYKGKTKFKKLH